MDEVKVGAKMVKARQYLWGTVQSKMSWLVGGMRRRERVEGGGQ